VRNKIQGETLVDLLRRPNDVHQQKIVAHSVIDQDTQRLCHGTFGIITKIPHENMVDCSPTDMLSEQFNLYEINNLRKKFKSKKINAKEILEQSRNNTRKAHNKGNNEILAIGTYKNSKIATEAVFYLEDPFGKPYQPFLVSKLKEFAASQGLKVIPFKHRVKGEVAIEKDTPENFKVSIDGIFYSFSEQASTISSRYSAKRPMTKNQFLSIPR